MTIPAAQRGATTIADRVIARTATAAAREALHDLAHPTATARATGTTRRGTARLTLALDLPYPIDIPATTDAVHQHVSHRTAALMGLPVGTLRIRVERLHLPEAATTDGRQVR
ncbi:hypothetical protein [Streptomyces buecherae]|uniref:hypothetical protein n=1 Tax=Streptomyces buecherae TaxID=2763006 RepID=UPI001C26FE4F|nr:hypothetical protein [Streptomyces buecherae]